MTGTTATAVPLFDSRRRAKSPQSYPGHSRFVPYLLNRATDLLNADFQRELRRRRLTLTHWRVIALLVEEDGLSVTMLAERSVTDQSTLSRALMQMEKQALVQRRVDGNDNRSLRIFLTTRGRNQFARILPIALKLRDEAFSGLSGAELDALASALRRIADNLAAK